MLKRHKINIGKYSKTAIQSKTTRTTTVKATPEGYKRVKVLGQDIIIRKHKQTGVKDFIKYNKEVVNRFIEEQSQRLGRPIQNVERYIKNYARTYDFDYEELYRKSLAPTDLINAGYAYDILEETGSLEDLQAEVNEDIQVERIHYLGSNKYEYVGSKRKCVFEIRYYKAGKSNVEVIIDKGVDIV